MTHDNSHKQAILVVGGGINGIIAAVEMAGQAPVPLATANKQR